MKKLHWTLLAAASLGRAAHADPDPTVNDPQPTVNDPQPAANAPQPTVQDTEPQPPAVNVHTVPTAQLISVSGALTEGMSLRGVAEDYMVLPSGGELTGDLKVIATDAMPGAQSIPFGDLALFELSARHSLGKRFDVAASVAFLPKQPSYTDDKAWQSASGGLRMGLPHELVLAVGGAGGHLLDHTGEWFRESALVEWKHTLNEFVAFDLQGGGEGVELAAPGASGAHLTELAISTSSFFREPTGHWGAWLGIAYALPIEHGGVDPTTAMAIDPQARLDLHIGTVWAVVPEWDLFVDAAVITRGDAANPATRLPILDGGFDQRQLVLGVTRHFSGGDKHSRREVGEPLAL